MGAGGASLSVVVPVLDEGHSIAACLGRLAPLRLRGAEVVVVDGGSRDGTRELAGPLADLVIEAARGRAAQMNAGASASRGTVLLFLHADTLLPPGADRLVLEATAARPWGRFDVTIDGRSAALPVIAFFMNWRSRLTGIATGDQAIFVRREAFDRVGGFPAIALMEDVALSSALRRFARPACLSQRVVTSGRRWDAHGAMATVLLMWRLRLAFALGADPAALARRYGGGRAHG